MILIFVFLSALYDNGKRFKDHSLRWIFRVVVVSIISYFTPVDFIGNLLFNTSVFYFIFDYLLNALEGRKWNYIGNTAIHDIVWVKYLGGWIPQLIFKLIFLIITIII